MSTTIILLICEVLTVVSITLIMIIFGYYVVCLNMLVCIIELGEVVESCIEVFLCPCEVS